MLSVLIKFISSSGLGTSFESWTIARTIKVTVSDISESECSITGFLNKCYVIERIPLR